MSGEDFDGDRTIETRVASAINFAHTACTERFSNFVWAESRSWSECHGGGDYISRRWNRDELLFLQRFRMVRQVEVARSTIFEPERCGRAWVVGFIPFRLRFGF